MIDLTDISLGPCQVPTHTKSKQAGSISSHGGCLASQTGAGAPPGETIGGLPRMPNQAGARARPSITQYSSNFPFKLWVSGNMESGEMQQ